MEAFITPMQDLNCFKKILGAIKDYKSAICINGPSSSQKVHLAYSVALKSSQKGIFVAHNELAARKAYSDFTFFGGEDVLFLPHIELVLHDISAESLEVHFKRLEVLDRIICGNYKFIVTSPEVLMKKFIKPERFKKAILNIALNSRVDYTEILYKLTYMGYERVNVVEGKGQFTQRGGIVDVFPINAKNAVRIELFGDEVDSIRYFDATNQRSIDNISEVRIIPAREILYFPNERESIIASIEKELQITLQKSNKDNKTAVDRITKRVNEDIDRLKNEYYFAGMERYISHIPQSDYSLIDYIDKETLFFVEEPNKLSTKIHTGLFEHYDHFRDMLEKGFVLPTAYDILFGKEDILHKINENKVVFLNTIQMRDDEFEISTVINIAARPVTSYNGKFETIFDDLKDFIKKGKRVVVLCGTRVKSERFTTLMNEQEIAAKFYEDVNFNPQKNIISVTHGTLNEGFEYTDNGFILIADRELFGEDKQTRKDRFKSTKTSKLSVFAEIEPGSYVVHYAHGIGQYIGTEKLTVEGADSDYLKIRYFDGDYLYVPVSQLDLVQKYIGSAENGPKLNRLGTGEWGRAKSKVKESLKEIAGELIKVYAEREVAKGHRFSKDTVWQKQLEEMFPFEETQDQLRCIEEIKKDMESDKPMDRLLCGDVGFGKTEVALRAVFKSIMDGKQVVYLVPTTVLAFQQYTNFKERMKDFPVRVEMLSRFKTPAQQSAIIHDAKRGLVDVIVGTHRVVQKDIKFKELGLLVIDEEQRFGVTHKEYLKKLKANVDVLTLTATPIPRTLHMSLVGIRDISIIEEPPEDRHPVQTFVMEYNDDIISEAVEREIARNGQIFYLYNTIRTIELKKMELERLIPDVKIEIAHGQMSKNRLEEVMQDFLDKKFNMLLCSTIIESGLDFPNVNTIIVEESDKLGLAQLYQIRGRVGRSNKIAYAYLTFKRDKTISEIAEKRLQAIREFTELGSGFKIAMRDLEIRGAGNIIGNQQHGHMDAVGYEMYMRLLNEAVMELQGNFTEEVTEATVNVDFNVNAFISSNYISDEVQKLNMYKKIAAIENINDYEDLMDEFLDRYGDVPEETRNLIDISFIRALTKGVGIESISQKDESFDIVFCQGYVINFEKLGMIMDKYKKRVTFHATSKPYMSFKHSKISKNEMLQNIKLILQDFKNLQK